MFVSNRVAEIREHSNIAQWHHVEGKINPADLATRGMTIKDMTPDSTLFTGPDYFHEGEKYWPSNTVSELAENDPELKAESLIATTKVMQQKSDGIINFHDHSKWGRVIAIVAWIWRFISNTKKRKQSRLQSGSEKKDVIIEHSKYVTGTEINIGERLAVGLIQKENVQRRN